MSSAPALVAVALLAATIVAWSAIVKPVKCEEVQAIKLGNSLLLGGC
jgi:hypothetical protein